MALKAEYARGWGALVRFRGDPTGHVADLGRRSVDVWNLRFGRVRNLFLVNNAELIQNILVTHDWNFIKGRGLRNSKPMLGEGLLTSEGELHRRERRIAQPAFHSSRLRLYSEQIVACVRDLIDEWEKTAGGATVGVHEEMMRLTLRIVGLTLFSADVARDAQQVGASMKLAMHLFLRQNHPLVQMIGPLRKLNEKRARESRRGIEKVLLTIIEGHRREPERYDDMLSMLMGQQDESGTGFMSDKLLLDECLTIFLAGHETTANALTWSWYLLSQNPEVEARLYAELAQVLAGRMPSIDDMEQLPYTTAIVKESLRLYPPAWFIVREAVTPYRLEEIEVPAGANLAMSPFATHRDPRYWVEPETFRPERWLENGEGNGSNGNNASSNSGNGASRPRFAFYPFGAGTRVCIGEHFAMMEAVLVVAAVAQHFRLRMVEGQKVELWPQITLRPRHEMMFHIEPRPLRGA